MFVNYISIECLWVLAVRKKGKHNKYELKGLKIYYNFIFESYVCMDLPILQRKGKKEKIFILVHEFIACKRKIIHKIEEIILSAST